MVRHIVMWKLKEDVKPHQAIDILQPKFKNLLGKVEGLEDIDVGINYNGGEYDIVLYCVFASKKAQDDYQANPLHLEIKTVVHSLVCGRTCADTEF